MRLNGKVAIITGASKGLGLDVAKLFAKNGSKVVITDVNDHDGLLETNKIQNDFFPDNNDPWIQKTFKCPEC